jgi:hypothetical protein
MKTPLLVACTMLTACGAPFTADPSPAAIFDDAGEDAPPRTDAPDAAPDASDASPVTQPDASDAGADAPDTAPDACAPANAYQCGLNLLTIETPASVCLLSVANQATVASVPQACRCDFTCACLLASGAFCVAAECAEGSGFPIIRGCT